MVPRPPAARHSRFWDGAAWTAHQAPGGEPSADSAAHKTTFAWLLAATPAVFLVMDVLLMLFVPGDTTAIGNAIALGLVVGLVMADAQALERAGVRVSKWWGILLLPVYLVLRTKRARSTVAVPLTWLVLVAGYLAASYALAPVVDEATSAASRATLSNVPAPAPTDGADPNHGADPPDSSETSPSPAPFTPTASVEHVGGARVWIECWVGTPYGDDFDYVGRSFKYIWPALSPDCSPTETSGIPSAKERRALRRAYPGEPIDASALAPLYAICAENDEQWLDELYYEPTPELARLAEGAMVLCPRHPQRDKATWLLANLDLSGQAA